MSKKNMSAQSINQESKEFVTDKEKDARRTSKGIKALIRISGVILLGIIVSVYGQGIPLLLIFFGAYIGVPADAGLTMDVLVWFLSSFAMLIPLIYLFIYLIKKVWVRFIIKAYPLYTFKKKESKSKKNK